MTAHLSREAPATRDQLGRCQLIGAGRGARDEVGEAEAFAKNEVLFPGPEAPGGEAASVQGGPEAVAGAGEMIAGRCGVEPGIDAAKKHLQARPDDVAQRPCASGLELPRRRLKLAGRGSHRTSRPAGA